MMESMRWAAGLVIFLLAGIALLYVAAGRSAPPTITILKPDRAVGQIATLDVTTEAPDARFTAITIELEQKGKRILLYALNGAPTAELTQVDRNRVRITRPLGQQSVPEL